MKNHWLLLLIVLFFMGCSVHYGPRIPGFIPGYVDERLGDSTYRIRVGEAWPKDWDNLDKIAIYRAAEITKEQGKRFFAILSASSRINNYNIEQPTTVSTTGTVNYIGNTAYINATSQVSGGQSIQISGGWYTLEFRILSDSEAEERLKKSMDITDSELVFKDLKYFIDRKK